MLILFDIDDTLLDHSAAARAGAIALRESVGARTTVEEFVSLWREALERHFARYLAGEVTYQEQRRARIREVLDFTLTDARADRVFEGYLPAYVAAWSLFPDVTPCLDLLSSSHSLGVVSNGEAQQQRQKLTNTGIADRFKCIMISEECGFAKPSKEIFLRACEIAGESPTNTIYVGDRYDVDAEGAREAGLVGVWLDRLAQATTNHLPPVIRALDELSKFLDTRTPPNSALKADDHFGRFTPQGLDGR